MRLLKNDLASSGRLLSRSLNSLHWTEVEPTRKTPRTANGSILATSLERSSVQYASMRTAPTTEVAMRAFLAWSELSESRVRMTASTSVQKAMRTGIITMYWTTKSTLLRYFFTLPLKSLEYLLRSSLSRSFLASAR